MSPLIRRFDAADEYYFEEGCYIHELSNSPDDPLMSAARARLPLGGQTRWHRLHNVVERYLIEAGEGGRVGRTGATASISGRRGGDSGWLPAANPLYW